VPAQTIIASAAQIIDRCDNHLSSYLSGLQGYRFVCTIVNYCKRCPVCTNMCIHAELYRSAEELNEQIMCSDCARLMWYRWNHDENTITLSQLHQHLDKYRSDAYHAVAYLYLYGLVREHNYRNICSICNDANRLTHHFTWSCSPDSEDVDGRNICKRCQDIITSISCEWRNRCIMLVMLVPHIDIVADVRPLLLSYAFNVTVQH